MLGEHCSDREQRAEAAERELTKVKLLELSCSTRIGEELDAVVTGVEEFGLFVQGIELPAEGLVHVSVAARRLLPLRPRTHTLTGHRSGNRYRLGDTVRVAVARVDVDRRELDFRLVRPNRRRVCPSRGVARGERRGDRVRDRGKKHGKDSGHDPRGRPKEKRPKSTARKRGDNQNPLPLRERVASRRRNTMKIGRKCTRIHGNRMDTKTVLAFRLARIVESFSVHVQLRRMPVIESRENAVSHEPR